MGATLASNAALSLGTWIDSLAVIHGERPALFADDAAVSYRELALRGRRLATGLSKIGVRKGDRVAVWLPNVSAWVEMLLACGRLGAIVVAPDTATLRSGEVSDDCLSIEGARAGLLAGVSWHPLCRHPR